MNATEDAIDLVHLNRYTGGDPALNAEILLLFEQQCRDSLAKLEELAAREPDARAWRQAAHTLKGAARGVGAFAFGEAAAAAERAGGDRESAAIALQALKAQYAAVEIFLARFRDARV